MIQDDSEPDVSSSSPPVEQANPSPPRGAWQPLPPTVRRALLTGGAAAGVIALVYAALAGSPHRSSSLPRAAAPKPASVAKLAAVRPLTGPAREQREALVESVVRSQKKRIM